MATKSRSKRWSDAVSDAQAALTSLQAALSELAEIQSEYQEWRDNLPENLESGTLGEKLDAVCDLEIADSADEIESMLGEAESAELPMGFGRD